MSLLHEAGLAKEFWSFAVKHVVWIRNRFHHSSLEDKAKDSAPVSPFERLHGHPPRVAMARSLAVTRGHWIIRIVQELLSLEHRREFLSACQRIEKVG